MSKFTAVFLAINMMFAASCKAPAQSTSSAAPPAAEQIRLPTPTPDAADAGTPPQVAEQLLGMGNWGPAPELANAEWLNSPPLRLADLRGKVVLVEFWTFGCINCQNVTPALQRWHEAYTADGLVIVGVHTPEFNYEKELANVAAAVERMGVAWPVAIDNDRETWNAYNNHYWPAMHLVDKQGNIRYLAIGEGNYERTEAVIKVLLAEAAG